MSPAARPTSAQMARRLIVLAAAIFSVAVAYGQRVMGWGQSAEVFSADSDATLRVVGYAFAIWGPIYLALAVYAVRQALPMTGESRIIGGLGWPSALALGGIGAWIVAAAFDWEVMTIVLIVGSLSVLLIALLSHAPAVRALPMGDPDRWTVVWPLSLLAGWLTIAAPVNLITVATGNGDLPTLLSPSAWAMTAIGLVVLGALAVTQRIRTIAYPIPVAWGLFGAFAAEQDRNPPLAYFALGAAVALLAGAVVLTFQSRPGVERAARP